VKIGTVGAEMIHADGEADMTKLLVDFCNFANAPLTREKYDIRRPITLSASLQNAIQKHVFVENTK
jgi:hypothetical protein